MYHNLCGENEKEHVNVCTSIKDFEIHIKYLKKYYNIVPLSDLIERIYEKKDFLPNSIAITFDDGYRNNFLLAFPIIKKYKIPITIFLTAGFINTNNLLWVNELEYIITETKKQAISLNFSNIKIKYSLETKKQRLEAYKDIKEKLKALPDRHIKEIISDLLLQLEVNVDIDKAKNYQMLSWNEISNMKSEFVIFGSHTISHPILTNLDEQNLKREIIDSSKYLKDKLNQDINFFCYPNGDYHTKIKQIVMDHYKAAVTTEHGFIRKKSDPFELPRIGTRPDIKGFIWRLIRPT